MNDDLVEWEYPVTPMELAALLREGLLGPRPPQPPPSCLWCGNSEPGYGQRALACMKCVGG